MTDTEETHQLNLLPLWPIHTKAGAKLMPLAGWQVASHFGDPETEYANARERGALLDAGFMTVVAATGADHIEYLNRRLSQRVIALEPGQQVRANQLSGDGRMEADFDVVRISEEKTLLLAPPTVSGTYLQELCEKYVFTEDAVFTNETALWAKFALFGPAAKNIAPDGATEFHELTSSFLPGARFILTGKNNAQSLYSDLLAKTKEAGGGPIGFLAFDSIRVEAGTAWWGIDLSERSIPLEADLMDAIHTNKGCYPGQETIAKVMNLGHPARKLVGIIWETDDPPPANTPLHSGGATAGTLTSSTYSPKLKRAVGLAMVKWPFRNGDTEMSTEEGLGGKVVALPFR